MICQGHYQFQLTASCVYTLRYGGLNMEQITMYLLSYLVVYIITPSMASVLRIV